MTKLKVFIVLLVFFIFLIMNYNDSKHELSALDILKNISNIEKVIISNNIKKTHTIKDQKQIEEIVKFSTMKVPEQYKAKKVYDNRHKLNFILSDKKSIRLDLYNDNSNNIIFVYLRYEKKTYHYTVEDNSHFIQLLNSLDYL